MKRLGLALAALAAITFLSAPVFARTTLANFPGSPQALEELHRFLLLVVLPLPG